MATTSHDVADLPWMLPVPVRRAAFESLRDADADCAVQTDLAAIGAFGVPRGIDRERLLYADRQSCPEYPSVRALGSGRAGCHRGRYLKGVGRTPLATNWADAGDVAHSSGHLYPSSAAREFLVSAYVDACGGGDTVVPCTGVLVRTMPRRFADDVARAARQAGRPLAPVDRRLQAISVKPAGFARWSNLLALTAGARAESADLLRLCAALRRFAGASAGPGDADVTPSAIARLLVDAVERAADAFAWYFRIGVNWGSFSNNFTLDGRFLDLEVPVVVCEPLPYQMRFVDSRRTLFGVWAGTETLQLADQTRAAIGRLRHWLSWVAAVSDDATTAAFAEALASALHDAFGPGHWLYDEDALAARVAAVLQQAPSLPFDASSFARAVAAERRRGGVAHAVATELADFQLAAQEPGIHPLPFVVRGARSDPAAAERRALINMLFAAVERTTTPDAYLRALDEGAALIRRSVRATRAQPSRAASVLR